MWHIWIIFVVVLIGVVTTACDTKLPVESTPISAPTSTILPTVVPTNAPIPTAVVENILSPTTIPCPPFPLMKDLPLPNSIEDFIGLYYQFPGGQVDGIDFHFSVVTGDDGNYKIGFVSMGNTHMLWFLKKTCIIPGTDTTPQSYIFDEIVNILELPAVGLQDYAVDISSCFINGGLSPHVVGLGKKNNGSGVLSEPQYAWEINIQDEAFVPIETRNIACDFDLSRP